MLSRNDKMRKVVIFRLSRQTAHDLVAAEGESERGADFFHSFVAQPRETRTKLSLRNNGDVVKVHHARPLHSVFDVKKNFGGDASNSRSNWGYSDGREVSQHRVSSEQENRPLLVGGRKSSHVDISTN